MKKHTELPPGNNHEKIEEALHAHHEQMDFIEHTLLPAFVRDPDLQWG